MARTVAKGSPIAKVGVQFLTVVLAEKKCVKAVAVREEGPQTRGAAAGGGFWQKSCCPDDGSPKGGRPSKHLVVREIVSHGFMKQMPAEVCAVAYFSLFSNNMIRFPENKALHTEGSKWMILRQSRLSSTAFSKRSELLGTWKKGCKHLCIVSFLTLCSTVHLEDPCHLRKIVFPREFGRWRCRFRTMFGACQGFTHAGRRHGGHLHVICMRLTCSLVCSPALASQTAPNFII